MNPLCAADPSHQHHSHDIALSLSGQAFGAIEAGGLLQQERPWIAEELNSRRIGFGRQYVGTLTREDAEALWTTLHDYGEMFSDRGSIDDEYTHREGLACARDAKRLRAALDHPRND